MYKTPSVAYYERKIRITAKTILYAEIDEAPLTIKNYKFLADIIEGLTNEQLSRKYKKSPSRVSQWKRAIFEQMHEYDLHQLECLNMSNKVDT